MAAQPKPIRFVATYDGPSQPKKQRTLAACYTCRKRKTRCDGDRPVCKACSNSGQVCLGYAKSRRLQTGSGKLKPANPHAVEHDVEVESQRVAETSVSPRASDAKLTDKEEHEQNGPTYPDLYHDNMPSASENWRKDMDETLALSQSSNLSVPYFRYFGPSAIVPGFKQTVVKLKEHRQSPKISLPFSSYTGAKSIDKPPLETKADCQTEIQSPVYDPGNPEPVNPLIEHLVDTFFDRLGCNFPFLRRDRFMAMLREKKAEAILVYSICAVAARFSSHPLLTTSHSSDPDASKHLKSDFGQNFARRAKFAVVDSFPCPTLASIQACLLLSYVSFGTNQDSALWLFLGCAIRMVQDLGLQKLEGVKYPSQRPDGSNAYATAASIPPQTEEKSGPEKISKTMDMSLDRDIFEAELTDTFWAVLMLDRVISSGTGRPVTLRDEDVDLPFPPYTLDPESGWPVPFPALIRILHLYGRVTDLLNTIRDTKDVTPGTRRRLDEMESDLTSVYEGLDQRLTFNVLNFQHYVEAGQGANFVMVHFWFHTLIIILHQPTLLHSYGGSVQELFLNSRELSMSSAKTIADILTFAELIDAKTFLGNPFTSQPIYVAACAFLKEMAAQAASFPNSIQTTPLSRPSDTGKDRRATMTPSGPASDNSRSKKHSLLASAAKQNYQRCYKALKQLETHWAGIKYILTALDQKAEGVWDPEIYTIEEMASARQNRACPPNSQDLSGKSSCGIPESSTTNEAMSRKTEQDLTTRTPDLQAMDAGQMWTLNGNTNSSNANITFLYPNTTRELQQPNFIASSSSGTDKDVLDSVGSLSSIDFGYLNPPRASGSGGPSTSQPQDLVGEASISAYPTPSATSTNAHLNHGVSSQNHNQSAQSRMSISQLDYDQVNLGATIAMDNYRDSSVSSLYDLGLQSLGEGMPPAPHDLSDSLYPGMMGDMMIESQDIDMNSFTFGDETFPWWGYIPQDSQSIFNSAASGEEAGSGK
ncbi:hypothetical protein V498_02148 [Pseudogymnoascus sp. VKM F-4517 (FW-2822)]|nr:hypothetical protein V498_02148 [Pseudogymnoascus sp. VKM F-4517 (FW-2822)]